MKQAILNIVINGVQAMTNGREAHNQRASVTKAWWSSRVQ